MFPFQNYLARNFYNLRFLALFVCFAINFILLFYKVSPKRTQTDKCEFKVLDICQAGVQEWLMQTDEHVHVVFFFFNL